MTKEDSNKLITRLAAEHAVVSAITVILCVALCAWIFSFTLWSFIKLSFLFGILSLIGGFLTKVGELTEEQKKEQVRQSVRP